MTILRAAGLRRGCKEQVKRLKDRNRVCGAGNPGYRGASNVKSGSSQPSEVFMNRRRASFLKWIVSAAVALVCMGGALPALASLGGDVGTIQADQVNLQGTRRTTTVASYTVHEIQAASGM